MTVAAIVSLLAAVAAASTPPFEGGAVAAKRRLRACGAEDRALVNQPDSLWQPIGSRLADHTRLRAALSEPMPAVATSIMIYVEGGHMATTEISVVLTRGAAGEWRGTSVGRSQIWVPGNPAQPLGRQEWSLPQADGKRIDAILADRCFMAGPTSFPWPGGSSQPPPLGALSEQIDTVTPMGRHSTSFLGGTPLGSTAELVSLTSPR